MFCMGCGAETPPRASACPVCGRPLGASTSVRAGDVPPAADVASRAATTRANAAPRVAPTTAAALDPAPVATATLSGPSINRGDLATTGFPRDTLGRAVIFTVLAMCADLVAPWVNLDGARIAPSSVGLPILGAVVVLGLAALPVVRPNLRATPLYAAAPLVIGAASFGGAGAVWLRATLSSAASNGADVNPGGALQTASFAFSPVYIADVGLYLFLAGAVVLVCTGYQLFLAAARASAVAELRATALTPVTRGAASTLAGSAQAAAAAPVPTSPAASVEPAPSTAAHPLQDDGDATSADGSPPAAGNGRRASEIALPGSPAWNQAPMLPTYQRPSPTLGWRRRST